MSITQTIFLTELNADTIARVTALFEKNGISINIDPQAALKEPQSWDGFIPVVVSRSANGQTESNETGFEVYSESFTYDANEFEFDVSSFSLKELRLLQDCTTALTVVSTATPGGFACAICFASALRQSAPGIWLDDEAGEFASKEETLKANLDSGLADEMFQKGT